MWWGVVRCGVAEAPQMRLKTSNNNNIVQFLCVGKGNDFGVAARKVDDVGSLLRVKSGSYGFLAKLGIT